MKTNNTYSLQSIGVAILCLLALALLTGRALASVPPTVSYQGYLTDTTGTALDGPYSIQFTIYNVDTGGVPLWSNTQSVTVSQGLLSVQLGGSGAPFPAGLFDDPLWLGIEVGSDGEMTPRQSFDTVAFAFKADDALTLEGQSADSLDQSAHLTDINNPHAVTAAQTGALSGTELTTHVGDEAAHHIRYADSEAVDAIKAADGAGSGLDADLLDGQDSGAFGSATQQASNAGNIATNASSISANATAIVALQAQVTALQDLLQHFTRNGNNLYVTGANLHLRSGSSSTDGAVNGLGNLIVGYNETRSSGSWSCSLGNFTDQSTCEIQGGTWALNHKNGSHNVVVGTKHNYSRYGGLVTGDTNSISGRYASVSGGKNNTAGGTSASVSGGSTNTITGNFSSISGGEHNIASGIIASVNGGQGNTASGTWASVSGGQNNIASGTGSSALGGGGSLPVDGNKAFANYSVIVGGRENLAGDPDRTDPSIGAGAVVCGGQKNVASGPNASVSGGDTNEASGTEASVTGGFGNEASGNNASVNGGKNNIASGDNTTVSGGDTNVASSTESTVSGGAANHAAANNATVGGGNRRVATGANNWVAGSLFESD